MTSHMRKESASSVSGCWVHTPSVTPRLRDTG